MIVYPNQMKNMKRFLSMGLSTVIATGVVAPAFAANSTHSVEVYFDESNTPAHRIQVDSGNPIQNMSIFEQGSRSLAGVKVESGDFTQSETSNIDGMTGQLPNGTTFTLNIKNTNNVDTLMLSTSNVVDDIKLTVNTTDSTYTVTANSGELGSNNNYGNDGSPTCSVSDDGLTVVGGKPMSLTFTPNAGKQIKKLNIRSRYSNKSNLVDVTNGSVTVEGLTFQVNRLSDGQVSVSSQSVTRDLFITALTEPRAQEYNLTVLTDDHMTSDVRGGKIYSDTTAKVTFTPDNKYSVYKFLITQGDNQKTVYATDSSVVIGNETYKITRSLNGQVTIEMPKAVADVKIEGFSTVGSYCISVNGNRHVSSNYDDSAWVGYGEDATIVLTPDDGYNIEFVTVAAGDDSARVSTNETSFRLNGRDYRMKKDNAGVVYLYIKDIDSSIEVTPIVDDTGIDLTIKTDGGIICKDEGSHRVESGDVFQTVFEPKDGCVIEEIKVTRDGRSYTADKGDSYLNISGNRCPINWMLDGSVSLTLYGIDRDMTVSVESNYNSGRRMINCKPDSHSKITHDARNDSYANVGEEVNVKVDPDNGYELSSVKVTAGKDVVTLYKNTNRFILNNRAYYVDHRPDGTWIINFSSLPASITVSSSTVRSGIDIPTHPSTDGYHHAYLTGVGNGLFAANRNMTRAEAVTMLSRLYYDAQVDGYKSTFSDVSGSSWYNNYLGWAQANGLLDSDGYFRPNDFITRAEFVDLMVRFSGVNTSGYDGYSTKFSDINPYWVQAHPVVASEIAYAAANGWISGYTDGLFHPDRLISRCEVVVITNRATGRVPDKQYILQNMYSMNRYNDVPVNHWAFYDVMEATNNHNYYSNNGSYESWGRR